MTQPSVLARAPVRISFGGGGTDLAAYYEPYGGLVVSTTITRYTYVLARASRDRSIRIMSADYNISQTYRPGEPLPVDEPLSLPKAAIAHFAGGLRECGVDLTLAADVPPGMGLGSSSAMAVSLVHALATYLGEPVGAATAADLACRLEIERLGLPIGRQDQYASAYGGLNAITFTAGGVTVERLPLSTDLRTALGARVLLFSTGRSRHSGSILRRQQADSAAKPAVIASLHHLKALAEAMRNALCAGDLDAFGNQLDEAWQYKKRLSGAISSDSIDRWYAAARAAGAQGGKITGAGGGGFLMLCCPVERQQAVRAVLAAQGLKELAFDLDTAGAGIVPLGLSGDTLPSFAGRGFPRRPDSAPWPMSGCTGWQEGARRA